MDKLKEIWKKIDLKVAMVSGAIVVTTSLGTCHFMDGSEVEPAAEEAPAEEAPAEDAAPEEEAAPAEEGEEPA